ncbi:hypothetical protein HPB47_005607 [Ixodes persulcatus]|uniref:Uncharacterized protein n=1 Tax=Ixodes persulcatus TaxID=34615 RepID=A0AC60PCJ7_IXOPE|nr:hypothetical protein HPB47_005607 [Ixodes persulcatus]
MAENSPSKPNPENVNDGRIHDPNEETTAMSNESTSGGSQQSSREAYITALNQWLWQCYHWQCFSAALPYVALQASTQNRTADLEKYDFDTLRIDALNYRLAFEMTSEIVVLELIHRVLVCLYETICLHRGSDTPGGRTPGKGVFGLKVVSCASVEDIGDSRIRVYPAGDIGLGWALLRSFVKNFTMAFLFPACLTIFCFQHGRAAYDILCNCIVVEELPQRNE